MHGTGVGSVPHRVLTRVAAGLGAAVLIGAAAVLALRYDGAFLGSAGEGGAAELKGQVRLTMTAAGLTAPYVFDIGAGRLTREGRVAGDFLMLAVTAPKTGDIAYRCANSDGSPAVCVLSAETDTGQIISRNTLPLKRHLTWSPDEQSVMYAVYASSSTPPQSPDPNEWAVFLARADGSFERRVATGSIAFFSPDGGSVYALQRDGLHKHDLASGEDTAAWPVLGGFASRFTTLVLSRDGKKLAWSNPYADDGAGSVFFYDITSWHPLTLRPAGALAMRVWQLQFSPQGSALALSADDAHGQPALYAYVLGGEPRKLFDLSAYDRATVLSEWR